MSALTHDFFKKDTHIRGTSSSDQFLSYHITFTTNMYDILFNGISKRQLIQTE